MTRKIVIRLMQALGAGIVIAVFAGTVFVCYLFVQFIIYSNKGSIFKLFLGICLVWSLVMLGMMVYELSKNAYESISYRLMRTGIGTICFVMLSIAFMPLCIILSVPLYYSKVMMETLLRIDLLGVPYILCLVAIAVFAVKFPKAAERCKDWYVRTYWQPIEKVWSAFEYESETYGTRLVEEGAPSSGRRETLRVALFYFVAVVITLSVEYFDPPWWIKADTFEDPPWGYRRP